MKNCVLLLPPYYSRILRFQTDLLDSGFRWVTTASMNAGAGSASLLLMSILAIQAPATRLRSFQLIEPRLEFLVLLVQKATNRVSSRSLHAYPRRRLRLVGVQDPRSGDSILTTIHKTHLIALLRDA